MSAGHARIEQWAEQDMIMHRVSSWHVGPGILVCYGCNTTAGAHVQCKTMYVL
jgi:hypothetical protein